MADQYDLIKQLAQLETECVNPDTVEIDRLESVEIVHMINQEDRKVAGVVAAAGQQLARAAEMFAGTLRAGGRIFYIGAGTSGRLGVLDAAECPPTFGTEPSQIVGVISGGYDTLVLSREGVEDNREAAITDLSGHDLGSADMVIGIAASKRTPYTLAGLDYAVTVGAKTVFVYCNDLEIDPELEAKIDLHIPLSVGPEAITGSTRMKSGTVQKLALNTISTTAMILLGKTYGNLMIDLKATSEKLVARSQKILIDLFQIPIEQANELLEQSGGSVKLAVVMQKFNCDRTEAETRLAKANGFISKIPDSE
ncbi:MAG: N-acetylmuramic acid 6-phosphate etherase [candidate division Zixibacteria bacterium]|nr:N-acetylmuramic acid 6-phosphate etherase [candidate division Zixibacteria bacterium]